jgi:hypothetical protein
MQGEGSLFLVSKQNSNLSSWHTSDTLTIVKNRLKMRMLWSLKVKEVKNFKKIKSPNITKVDSQTLKILFFYVAQLLLEFKEDL